MGLSDVAGVFSRYFVVGFFVPSFVVLVLISQLITPETLPPVYIEASGGARIAVIGGTSLLTGLVLVGLNYPILRLFEGYPLRGHWFTRPVYAPLVWWQGRRLKKATSLTIAPSATDIERRNALYRLGRRFPPDVDDVLPTGLGNAIRAFERYSKIRWGLNAIAAWPRLEMLLSAEEQQLLAEAKSNVAFFVNGSLLAVIGGLTLIADRLLSSPHTAPPSGFLYAIPFVLSSLCYWASIGAAVGWGEVVAACIDLHRLELYEKVGLRAPTDFTDERENIALAFNAAVLRGTKIDDKLATNYESSAPTTKGGRRWLPRKTS